MRTFSSIEAGEDSLRNSSSKNSTFILFRKFESELMNEIYNHFEYLKSFSDVCWWVIGNIMNLYILYITQELCNEENWILAFLKRRNHCKINNELDSIINKTFSVLKRFNDWAKTPHLQVALQQS